MRPVGTALLRRLPCEQHEPLYLAVFVSTPLLLTLPWPFAVVYIIAIFVATRRAH